MFNKILNWNIEILVGNRFPVYKKFKIYSLYMSISWKMYTDCDSVLFAKGWWKRVVEDLTGSGVFGTVDDFILYC